MLELKRAELSNIQGGAISVLQRIIYSWDLWNDYVVRFKTLKF